MTVPYVEYRSVSKSYDGRHLAIANLDCAIRKGEFLTFLGPSGSGKTTALMILAGFEAPTAGDVLLNGRTLARTPPHKRNMGVVEPTPQRATFHCARRNFASARPLRSQRI